MNKIYQKTLPAGKNAGFTLIELLVVVLIIGILAAVALPQYEIAVWKARFASYMPQVKHIKDAQEAFYLANGRYAANFDELRIDLPPGEAVSANRFSATPGIKYQNGMVVFTSDRFAGVVRGGENSEPFGAYAVSFDHISGKDNNHWAYAPSQQGCHYWANHTGRLMEKVCKNWTGGNTRTAYSPNGFPGYSF